MMTGHLYLENNGLSQEIPSELASLTGLTYRVFLNDNEFCGELPSEVEAWTANLSSSEIITGNDIGTPCPTPVPTPVPVATPTPVPTTNGTRPEQALRELYDAAGGRNWTIKSGWMVGSPCSQNWYGILCDSNSNIVKVALDENNLNGTLPTTIGYLTTLEILHLQSNGLTDHVPSEVGQMASLRREFYLDSNSLRGTLPTEIAQLTAFSLGMSVHDNALVCMHVCVGAWVCCVCVRYWTEKPR